MNRLFKFFFVCFVFSTITLLSSCGISYTIYFDSNGGSEVASITTDGKSVVAIPNNPTKEGYEFDGWFWDKDTWLKPFTVNSLLDAPLSSDMIVYAKWHLKYDTDFKIYTLKELVAKSASNDDLYIDPSDMTAEEQASYNSIIGMYGNTVKISSNCIEFAGSVLSLYNPCGYTMTNNNVNIDSNELSGIFNLITQQNGIFNFGMENGGVSYIFVYESSDAVKPNYNFIFETNGGNSIPKQIIQERNCASRPDNPTRNEYIFENWYKESDFQTLWDFSTYKVHSDTIVYAKWTKLPQKTQLYVGNFNGAVGDEWLSAVVKRFEDDYADVSFETGKTGVEIIINNSYENIASTISASVNDIYITENSDYNELVSKNLILEITDALTEILSDYSEDVSIENKLYESEINYYKTSEGKYYGLPNYFAYGGIIYDVDLFEEYNFSIPSTYDDFFVLCARMINYNITPFTWTGQYSTYYINFLLNALCTDYEGYEEMLLNYTLDGVTATLIESINNGAVTLDDSAQITNSSGYKLYAQAGRYYALQFLEKIINGNYYSNKSFNLTQSHIDAQSEFLYSSFGNGKKIAMIIEGNWWENEANAIFEDMEDSYGEAAAKSTRKFGYMPLPNAAITQAGSKNTLYNTSDSLMVINKNTTKGDLAKIFLQYCYTDESLVEFTEITGMQKAVEYSLPEEVLNGLSYFCKKLWQLTKYSDIVFPYSNNELINSNPSYFDKSWYSLIDGTVYTSPVTAMRNYGISAQEYFEGIVAYHSSSEWSAEFSDIYQ